MLSFPGLNYTFNFMCGRRQNGPCFIPIPALAPCPVFTYIGRVRILGSASLYHYVGCWESTFPYCRKPVPVACTAVTPHHHL